jgi:guanylate kinase
MIFVISGPSGSGKSTLVRKVLEGDREASFSVSHTTRPSRNGEVEGEDYYFVSVDRFEEMRAAGDFAEFALVHGNYYGTSKAELAAKGGDGEVMLDIDVQGAAQIRRSIPEAVLVFILPPSYEVLRRRLESRGLDSGEVIARRLVNARDEILQYDHFDYVIVNDDLEQAVGELEAVVGSTRCRAENQRDRVNTILLGFDREK